MGDEVDLDEEMASYKAKSNAKKTQSFKDEENVSMTRLLDHIAFGSVSNISNATKNRVSEVPGMASNLVHGITDNFPDFLPDILPDAQKIDKLVVAGTIAAYAVAALGVTGSLYFSLRTVRELGQWRQWYRYRKFIGKKKVV